MIPVNSLKICLPHHRKDSNKDVNIRNHLKRWEMILLLVPIYLLPNSIPARGPISAAQWSRVLSIWPQESTYNYYTILCKLPSIWQMMTNLAETASSNERRYLIHTAIFNYVHDFTASSAFFKIVEAASWKHQ